MLQSVTWVKFHFQKENKCPKQFKMIYWNFMHHHSNSSSPLPTGLTLSSPARPAATLCLMPLWQQLFSLSAEESTAQQEPASEMDMAFFMLWGYVHHSGWCSSQFAHVAKHAQQSLNLEGISASVNMSLTHRSPT